jgi:hypothetical protein
MTIQNGLSALLKSLAIVGGNSRLATLLLSDDRVRNMYTTIRLVVGREFQRPDLLRADDEVICYEFDGDNRSLVFNTQLLFAEKVQADDILFLSTPTDPNCYNDRLCVERTLRIVSEEVTFGQSEERRAFIFGSVLVFLPYFGDRYYKAIKEIEYLYYVLRTRFVKNMFYLVLPPIGRSSSAIGRHFVLSDAEFVGQICAALNSPDKLDGVTFVGSLPIRLLSKVLFHASRLMR